MTLLEKQMKSALWKRFDLLGERIDKNNSIIDDLGLDSLQQIEMLMAMEDEFEIDIPDEDGNNMKTLGDVYNYLADKVDKKLLKEVN